jgi:3-oxoacyl-[acyl-carrier-protein] synthase II
MTSRRNDLGAAALAPYDRDRDGTVMGEGGAFLMLEELESAQARGATVHAEVVGVGAAEDGGRLGTPESSGRAVTGAIERALAAADASPAELGYVAAHGAGTPEGDASEAAGLRAALGDGDGAVASSVKGATGHLVGAAGALNAAVAALAIARGALPPTLHLENLDPACEGVDWVPKRSREARVDLAVSLARGLEGQNVALALRRV